MEMNSQFHFASSSGAYQNGSSERKHWPILASILRSCTVHATRSAFCIGRTHYTYAELATHIVAMQHAVQDVSHPDEKFIGIVANNDFQTYAGILGIWFSGRGYVPLNPRNPVERSLEIVRQAGIRSIVASNPDAFTRYVETHQKGIQIIR